MLTMLAGVFEDARLIEPGEVLHFYANITQGDSLSVSAFCQGRFFQVKLSEFVNLEDEFNSCLQAWRSFSRFVPRPICHVFFSGWSIMVSEGVEHAMLAEKDLLRPTRRGARLLRDLLDFFEMAARQASAEGQWSGKRSMVARMEQEIVKTSRVRLAAHWLEHGRNCGMHDLLPVPQHGDLVLNNIAHRKGSLVIFDWEDYGKVNVPGLDLATLYLSITRGDCRALRELTQDRAPYQSFLSFIREACSLQGMTFDQFRRLIPTYLLIFLYLKRNYGTRIQERIAGLLEEWPLA